MGWAHRGPVSPHISGSDRCNRAARRATFFKHRQHMCVIEISLLRTVAVYEHRNIQYSVSERVGKTLVSERKGKTFQSLLLPAPLIINFMNISILGSL